jgi:hypothetical protein
MKKEKIAELIKGNVHAEEEMPEKIHLVFLKMKRSMPEKEALELFARVVMEVIEKRLLRSLDLLYKEEGK